jgi:hypothetical protein
MRADEIDLAMKDYKRPVEILGSLDRLRVDAHHRTRSTLLSKDNEMVTVARIEIKRCREGSVRVR